MEAEPEQKQVPGFSLPSIHDNPVGWGPCAVPEQFKDIPYQPFSNNDRLGKVADWSGNLYQDKRSANKYGGVYGLGGQEYAYHHNEDESSFQLVDTTKTVRPPYQRNKMRLSQQKIRRDREKREERRLGGRQQTAKSKQRERDRFRQHQKKFSGRYGYHYDKGPTNVKIRQPSVQVSPDWKVEEEIEFSRLTKLNYKPEEAEELHICGSVGYYDTSKEKRITLKNPLPLQTYNRVFHKVSTTDDPIIRKFAKDGSCNVFATDRILATLMTCARSKYPWDIVVVRIGKLLFFDKRDDSNLDLLTVNETAKDSPVDDDALNNPTSLGEEATCINQNFSQQMLMDGHNYQLKNPNPFAGDEEEEVASVAYRYLRWKIGGNNLLVRCEHDAIMPLTGGSKAFINIKALNEWDNKRTSDTIDWRRRLDSQKGAILATELKNNSCKIAKWALCSVLAGSSFIKFGYVSRVSMLDSSRHEILGVQHVKPVELAAQMTLDVGNAWGILHAIIDTCQKLPVNSGQSETKYFILKDPNKPVLRIYNVPQGESEESGGSEESSSEEDKDDA